eukprot:TRINITY_DN710_c0_g2_i1.p1 TRINITY_DN710_c0_g2~~TRINITY_DN710_c0_g2_i1.p1  ORF type:complete len:543 (-),score=136.03 TRINITY_DN710_c0_g2_i1:34-1662(-)
MKRKSNTTHDTTTLKKHKIENMKQIGQIQDFTIGKLTEVNIGDSQDILILNTGEKLYATGAKCPHYGAPLVKGALLGETVRCPWHGACVDLTTGDIEDFPGCESVPAYEVVVEGEDVSVVIGEGEFKNKVTPVMAKRDQGDERVFVVVGAGCAGGIAAETLRQKGFTGRIVVISSEALLPYDRIKLSKNLEAKPEDLQWRTQEFYDEFQIELILGVDVTSLDPATKKIVTSDGQEFTYDKCLVATGGSPNLLEDTPGSDAQNILALRTVQDSHNMGAVVDGASVVIIGSSFIALELASTVAETAASVVVIVRGSHPLSVFGEEIGNLFRQFHESNGVIFKTESTVTEFLKSDDGAVNAVELNTGEIINCNVVLLGVGVKACTSFINPAEGLHMLKDGSISTDEFLFTGCEGLYAAGDITTIPYFNGEKIRVQHYGFAQTQGKIAAINMAGESHEESVVGHVPFFWTAQLGKNLRYAGHGKYDEIILQHEGDEISVDSPKFVAYFIKDNLAVAIATMNSDPKAAEFAQQLSTGVFPTKEEILA